MRYRACSDVGLRRPVARKLRGDARKKCARQGHYARRPGRRVALYHSLARPDRSEEHTSELQSLMRTSYAVFCLKKTNETSPSITQQTYPYRKPASADNNRTEIQSTTPLK